MEGGKIFETNQVLVTGAAGWAGSRLAEALARGLPDSPSLSRPQEGLRVRCLLQDGAGEAGLKALSDRVQVVQGDLRRQADCVSFCEGARGAVLFHVAGLIHPRRVSELYQVNVQGTRNLLQAAQAAGVRRAVVMSSNSPCGCNPSRDHLFDENSPYHPYMNYGRSKMQMELAVKEFQRGGGIETVIIRAPWFYGPNQPARQTKFFTLIQSGKVPLVGDGNHRRSMAYVDNISQGMILAALTAKAGGEIYWIADERPYTMNEILDTVERLLESEFHLPCAHRRIRLPNVACDVAWLMDKTLQGAGLYQQEIHVLSEMNRNIACSVAKAEAELGYAPTIALEEGMRRSVLWCLQNGQL